MVRVIGSNVRQDSMPAHRPLAALSNPVNTPPWSRGLPASPTGVEGLSDLVDGASQGHDTNAAALMGGRVRTAVHSTAGTGPGDVPARTDRVLIELENDLFVPCPRLHIDLAERGLQPAGAGHPPPLPGGPAPAAGRTVPLAVDPGPLLGIGPCTEADLPAGSLPALYTDGLVESPARTSPTPSPVSPATSTGWGGQSLDLVADTLLRHAAPQDGHTHDIALFRW